MEKIETSRMVKFWLISGALLGVLSVALGAFGAHALKNILDEYGHTIYDKAVRYQMFHAAAILIVGILQQIFKKNNFAPAGWAFLFGTIIFSGSLYILSVTGMKWLGAITPIGGTAFVFGWCWLGYVSSKI